MSDLTRRRFVTTSAGTAAGLTAIGSLVTAQAQAKAEAEANGAPVQPDPVVAYVKDPIKGDISIMSGDRQVSIRDPRLAARIVRAAR
jgi:hypothetical protein